MTNTRVPRIISQFMAYLINTSRYLMRSGGICKTNYERLGLSEEVARQWLSFREQGKELYAQYSAKREARTPVVTEKMNLLIKTFSEFSSGPLKVIEGSPAATSDDFAMFNIKARGSPTRDNTPIRDIPVMGMKALGGGEIELKFRSSTDSKRSSILKTATAVRYYVAITDKDGAPPVTVDGLVFHDSTKAMFILSRGQAARGKFLWVAAQWVNIRQPERNGPISTFSSVFIA
jgi:hypothetical protein